MKGDKMSTKINEIVEAISKLNILEVMDLTNAIEKKFNIDVKSDIKPDVKKSNVEKTSVKVEKTTYSVIMTNYGSSKINVIKTVRSILNLGLKEAKEFVEKIPAIIKENIQKDEAESIKKKLEASGAKIELK